MGTRAAPESCWHRDAWDPWSSSACVDAMRSDCDCDSDDDGRACYGVHSSESGKIGGCDGCEMLKAIETEYTIDGGDGGTSETESPSTIGDCSSEKTCGAKTPLIH